MSRATVLHRDRPDEDPAGAPSGLRWRYLEHGGWRLWRGEVCVGSLDRCGTGWAPLVNESCGYWRSLGMRALAAAARALVEEVRRG